MLSSETHSANAQSPIEVTLSGRATLVIRAQPSNAPACMDVMPSGITSSPKSSTPLMYKVLPEPIRWLSPLMPHQLAISP